MILVQLQGGLGNQMFQYACSKNLAIKNNLELKLDLSFLQMNTSVHTKRNFEMEVFDINTNIVEDNELRIFQILFENKIIKRIYKKFPYLNYCLVKENQASIITEMFNDLKKNNWIIGFWQSEKYFINIKDEIRKDFIFKEIPNKYNIDLINKIKNKTTVSLHVRRGDYVTDKSTNSYHGVMEFEYYQLALQILSSKISNFQIFIFSDDPTWVQSNFVFDVETIYIYKNTGNQSYNDMRLMSLCDHHIIANSSFSWWGAWLNYKPNKIVIAPKKWVLNSGINTNDVTPESWIKI